MIKPAPGPATYSPYGLGEDRRGVLSKERGEAAARFGRDRRRSFVEGVAEGPGPGAYVVPLDFGEVSELPSRMYSTIR